MIYIALKAKTTVKVVANKQGICEFPNREAAKQFVRNHFVLRGQPVDVAYTDDLAQFKTKTGGYRKHIVDN
jgi:hypothetical protein